MAKATEEVTEKVTKAAEPELTQEEKLAAYLNEKVPVKLFKDSSRYKDDVYVSVNGHNFQIQRGVEVMVPRYVKEVLDNSDAQEGVLEQVNAENKEKVEELDRL